MRERKVTILLVVSFLCFFIGWGGMDYVKTLAYDVMGDWYVGGDITVTGTVDGVDVGAIGGVSHTQNTDIGTNAIDWNVGNDTDANTTDVTITVGNKTGNNKVITWDGNGSDLWDFGTEKIKANNFESVVVTGTAPLVVASTTVVTNLNADKLDAYSHASFAKTERILRDEALTQHIFLFGSTYSFPPALTFYKNVTDKTYLEQFLPGTAYVGVSGCTIELGISMTFEVVIAGVIN